MKTEKINPEEIRKQFPILQQQVNGKSLIYFDNAATTQKPLAVINALSDYYKSDNANIHRGIHTLAERATAAYEATRAAVKTFLNAAQAEECIFTKGTTEGINLVAQTYGRANVNLGDEVLVSASEHHSNIVPWQMLCEEKGALLKVIPVSESGEWMMEEVGNLLTEKTKIVAVGHASNALGTINPVRELIKMAHAVGAKVLIDGAQASAHIDIDVQELDCDFYSISAHKMYGPTGVGVLYGKRALLEGMPPYQGGGEMIKEVTFEKTTWNDIPYKFEAGTPNIADVVAFKAAIGFINGLGKKNMAAHEAGLLAQCVEGLRNAGGSKPLRLVGTATRKVSVQSFVIPHMHHFDAGMMLDAKGIAVRTGHHCTQPLMTCLGIDGTVRASFAVYNTSEEVGLFIDAVRRLMTARM